ncbi:MAG: hypothetical protein M1831_005765 [Alyxoria varia]|nr:MAG: hypothetical protein M1831_005765 [Alyxoria varia]
MDGPMRYKRFPHSLIEHGQLHVLFERGQMVGKRLYSQTCKSCGEVISHGTPDKLVDHLAMNCKLAPKQAREEAERRKNARPDKPPRSRRKRGSNGRVLSATPTSYCSSPFEGSTTPASDWEGGSDGTLSAAVVASMNGGWTQDMAGGSNALGSENSELEVSQPDATVEQPRLTTNSSPNAIGIRDLEMGGGQDNTNVEKSNLITTRASAAEMEASEMKTSQHVDGTEDRDFIMSTNFSPNIFKDPNVAMQQVEGESQERELTFEDFGIFLGESPRLPESYEPVHESTSTGDALDPPTIDEDNRQDAMAAPEVTLEDLGIFLHDGAQEKAQDEANPGYDLQINANDQALDDTHNCLAERDVSEQNLSQPYDKNPETASTGYPSASEHIFIPDQQGGETPVSDPSLVTSPQPVDNDLDANEAGDGSATERRKEKTYGDKQTSTHQTDEMDFIITTGNKPAPEPKSKPKKTRHPPGSACMHCRLLKKPCGPSDSFALCLTCQRPGTVGNANPILCTRSMLKDIFDMFTTRLYKYLVADFTNAIGQHFSVQPTDLQIKATHFANSGILTQSFPMVKVLAGSIGEDKDKEVNISNVQKYCLDLEEKDTTSKFESYVQGVSERIIAIEECVFLQHTLNEALKASGKTPMLRKVVELFAATTLLTSPSLPWEISSPHTSNGGVVHLDDFGSRRVVTQQLYSYLEKFADDLGKRVNTELERRLIKRTGDPRDVDLFMTSIILLAVLDKYSWLYSTWCGTDGNDRNDHNSPFGKHPRAAWPFEGKDPRTFMQRFQNTAELTIALLRFRKIIPETYVDDEGYIGAYVPIDGGTVPSNRKRKEQDGERRSKSPEAEYAVVSARIKEADRALGTASNPIPVDKPDIFGRVSNINNSMGGYTFDRFKPSDKHIITGSSPASPDTTSLRQPGMSVSRAVSTDHATSDSNQNQPSTDILHVYPPNIRPIHQPLTVAELRATSREHSIKREREGTATTMDAVAAWLEKSRLKAEVVKGAPIMWDDAWKVWDPCDPTCWKMRSVSMLLWPRWETEE